MKPVLKIDFCDFWQGFNKEDNLLINLLKMHYDVRIDVNPEILIYSCYGFDHLRYTCYRIFYTAENVKPDFQVCDLSLSFEYDEHKGRNIRLPLYRWRGDLDAFLIPKNAASIVKHKTKFCCMVVSNPAGKERNEFFHLLNTYKKVDSGGKYLNNIGGPVADKASFISEYKFVMAFENTSSAGYTTEKLVEPFAAKSIAVYWGNPLVGNDFNTKSFINVHEFRNFKEVIDEIIRLDTNEQAYEEKISMPFFTDNLMPEDLKYEVIAEKLYRNVERMKNHAPVSRSAVTRSLQVIKKIRRKIKSGITGKPHWYY